MPSALSSPHSKPWPSRPTLSATAGARPQARTYSSAATVRRLVRAGRLRALGVGSLQRNPVLPDVPSIAEAGVADYETVNWFGLVAPAGTPASIIDRLSREVAAVQDVPEVRRQFDNDGATVMRMTPAQFGTYMAAEMEKWGRVVRAGGIKTN